MWFQVRPVRKSWELLLQNFYRPDALRVTQQTVSKLWRLRFSPVDLSLTILPGYGKLREVLSVNCDAAFGKFLNYSVHATYNFNAVSVSVHYCNSSPFLWHIGCCVNGKVVLNDVLKCLSKFSISGPSVGTSYLTIVELLLKWLLVLYVYELNWIDVCACACACVHVCRSADVWLCVMSSHANEVPSHCWHAVLHRHGTIPPRTKCMFLLVYQFYHMLS